MSEFIPGHSKKAVRRAGKRLRDWYRSAHPAHPGEPGWDETVEAFQVMIAFRETFQPPLNKTAMGLRSMVCSELKLPRTGYSVPVSQRLKRQAQMLGKLQRFPAMDLSRMGDIGGCRAVLPSEEYVDGVFKRIRRNWSVYGQVRDTRHAPAPSGYRALHIVVEREERLIEVQLRTPKQHEWAVAVERTAQRLRMGLKEGEGPAALREYFRLAGHGLYLEEQGLPAPPDFTDQFMQARELARPYFAPR